MKLEQFKVAEEQYLLASGWTKVHEGSWSLEPIAVGAPQVTAVYLQRLRSEAQQYETGQAPPKKAAFDLEKFKQEVGEIKSRIAAATRVLDPIPPLEDT
jgi:hypothetical protein